MVAGGVILFLAVTTAMIFGAMRLVYHFVPEWHESWISTLVKSTTVVLTVFLIGP